LAVVGFGARAWGLDTPAPPASPPSFANLDSQIAPSKSIEVKELSGADSFNLTVSTFRGATAAAALATRLETAGLPAFIRVDRGLHHVIVGPYLSHAEVVGVQSRLAGYGVTGTGLFVEYFEPPDARGGADRTSGLLARSQGAER
jgi:cell division septation protein DedD